MAQGRQQPFLVGVSCAVGQELRRGRHLDINFNDGGHTGRAAATSWNGKAWTATNVPAPGKGKASLFNEVSCPAAADCVAVGQLGPYQLGRGQRPGRLLERQELEAGTTP